MKFIGGGEYVPRYTIIEIFLMNDSKLFAVSRQRGRFAGFSLYVSNSDVSTTSGIKGSTLCYKDGPQLPPLNFTTTCIEHGRYVIFYNERLNGVTYPTGYELMAVFTELCEVIVQGKFIQINKINANKNKYIIGTKTITIIG